jgi:hypothetical protein
VARERPGHEQALGYLLVAPVIILLLTLVAYPFSSPSISR